MIPYDPDVIKRYAAHLYTVARGIVFVYTLVGAILGVAAGGIAGSSIGSGEAAGVYAVVGAVVLGLVGFPLGLEKSFKLRAEAQKLLCTLEIEGNTRKPA
jgi:hypothetical protein